ncbi:MAG: hypothetical protein H6722_11840 [Sandaracinus sp.]|nr:hypothetical protein [Sandaracinus sp.]MCB9613136.1 hypothetical protein [Sandaracinus sp.]
MNVETWVGVAAVLGSVGYAAWYFRNLDARTRSGEGPQLFHEAMTRNTQGLEPEERVVVAWSGQVWMPPTSKARELVGSALNAISKEAIGVSRFVPNLRLLVLSSGRVVVTEEHGDLGQRDFYRLARAWTKPVRASRPSGEGYGDPPKNPFDPRTSLILFQLDGADGTEPYVFWLSPTCMSVRGDEGTPDTILPIAPEVAARAWQDAVQAAKAKVAQA